MSNFKSLAILAAAATFLPSTFAVFDADSNSNVAIYWVRTPFPQDMRLFLNYYHAGSRTGPEASVALLH